jgi:hypothetical protein
METAKLLARAETAILYTRLFLQHAKEGKSKPASVDVVAGIQTGAGILGIRSTYMPGVKRVEPFQAVSRSCAPILKDLQKLKKITKADAEKIIPRLDRVVNKLEELWKDVQNGVCGDPAFERKLEKQEKDRQAKFDNLAKKSMAAYRKGKK